MNQLQLSAYGREITICAPPAGCELILQRLPAGFQPGCGVPERTWTLTGSEGAWTPREELLVLGRFGTLGDAVTALLGRLEPWVGAHAVDRLFIHAGAVHHRGGAILLPGSSLAGKTTLTLALVEAGAGYLSDEYAVIDRDGNVHPYSRPPAIRAHSPYSDGPRAAIQPPPAGGPAAYPVTLSAALRFVPGGGWRVHARSAGEGVLDLLTHTLAAQTRAAEAVNALAAISRRARFLQGVRSGAREAATVLLDWADRCADP